MSKLNMLIHSRKYIRKGVTEIHGRKPDFSILSADERASIRSRLQGYLGKLHSLDPQIQSLLWEENEDEDVFNRELESCERYENNISECMILLEERIATPPSALDTARSLLKSPTAPLPRFTSAEGEDVDKFFRDFEETTSKFNYHEYDKLLLLKQQISGRALLLLNSLEIDRQGYTHAKSLLLNALASPTTQKFNIIKKLVEMKLTYADDPFEYVSKMRTISQAVDKLNLDRDDFLQYFFWQGLNESFKTQFVQLTNSTRPSLQQLNEKFFEACERYEISQTKFKQKKKSSDSSKSTPVSLKSATGMAVNVNYQQDKTKSFKPCTLCTYVEKENADHPIHKCSKFDSSQAKLAKLKILNGCLKCSSLSHVTQECKFKFNHRCRHCNDWHFSFLCNKSECSDSNRVSSTSPSNESSKKNSKTTSSNSVTITEALQSDLDSESILPTFTCTLGNHKLRGLKDGGCQSNFVTDKFANSHNLKVLRDKVSLTINGINISQQYETRLVELDMKFGNQAHTVEALCIPSININLKLPNLSKVVDGFISKGYNLADEKLLNRQDEISGIDFILGTKSAYCVPDSDILFGKQNSSLYSQTAFGIMLKGDVQRLLDDLHYLPLLYDNKSHVQGTDIHTFSPVMNNEIIPIGVGKENIFTSYLKMEKVDSSNFLVVVNGKVNERELDRATKEVLESSCSYFTNYDGQVYEEESSELDDKLVKFCIDNSSRDGEGRLVMPLLWNSKVSHLLGKNQHLSKAIVQFNLKKLQKNPGQLKMMDDTFHEQEKAGIIERIENLEQFLSEHPEHSFLPHMGVFKLDRETTKCRVVFLSNLCERDSSKPMTVSHNQAIHAGPSLNQKLSSALIHLRFDSKLLCFDIKKAFNNIALNEVDSNRLLFLWFRNIAKGDFTLVGFRNVRLSFGLRCSPTILLLGLYKILVLDAKDDDENLRELKKLIYQLCYMDNLSVSMNDSEGLKWAYSQLFPMFDPYHFGLQQFCTNDQSLQAEIDSGLEEDTPVKVKLLGMQWDRCEDTLSTRLINLNAKANTKRTILSSIASQFDLYNFNGPILNRGRLFMHDLQCRKELNWDDKLTPELLKEWQNICKQANSTPEIKIKRFVGRRTDTYKLLAFSDTSKVMFGVVIFILNVESNELNFVMAKNRIVNKQLENKSIPSLEMQGIALATECLIDLYRELAGPSCLKPINIVELEVYSDSLVALSWLNSYTCKLEKMQKRSVFVLNRINHITKLCEIHQVKFCFISGIENPADAITRSLSYKQLVKTTFFSGPDFLKPPKTDQLSREDIISVVIPNPCSRKFQVEETQCLLSNSHALNGPNQLVLNSRFSSFQKLVAVYSNVLRFVNCLKAKLKSKNPEKFDHLIEHNNYFDRATKLIIRSEQHSKFPEIIEYFNAREKKIKDIPNLVKQLNIYMDSEGLLRVHSKCDRVKAEHRYSFPYLLPKDSHLTSLIIMDLHIKCAHAGCYSLLSELRKRFWVPHFFSVVRKALRTCVTCRRFNERTIKLNQSPYRDFRLDPPSVPYRNIFMDYMGPFYVKLNGKKVKVWVLCITCMFSRAINLKICLDLSVKEFLRSFQLHCFEFGIPQYCISDLGTQLVAASNIILDYLKDPETNRYFEENGVKPITFDHFFKGCSKLGSMVESCVKLTKRLIYGSMKSNILTYHDFEFMICQTIHLVNRRPIAFKEYLRDSTGNCEIPEPITPECLIRGYDLLSINIIPDLHRDPEPSWDPSYDPTTKIKNDYSKLQKVRNNLIDIYHSEFLANLVHQAVNVKDRYKPVTHKTLAKGDIVLIKEPHTKPINYPMGRVVKVECNINNEVTGAEIIKAKSREKVLRHSSVLIPLLTATDHIFREDIPETLNSQPKDNEELSQVKPTRPQRKAATLSKNKTKQYFSLSDAAA